MPDIRMSMFKRKMSYKGFSIGQRVVTLVDNCAGNNNILKDMEGIIVDIYGLDNDDRSPIIGIEWDKSVYGHNCGGYCKDGRGWYVYSKEIRHYDKSKRIKKV